MFSPNGFTVEVLSSLKLGKFIGITGREELPAEKIKQISLTKIQKNINNK